MPRQWTLGMLGVALFAGCSGSGTPPASRTSSPYEVAPVELPLDCMGRELWQDPESGEIGMELVEVSYARGCACEGPGRAAAVSVREPEVTWARGRMAQKQ